MDFESLIVALNNLDKGPGSWYITPIADTDENIAGVFVDLENKEAGVRYYLAEYIEPVAWGAPVDGTEHWRCIIDDKIIRAGIYKAAKVLIEERARL